MKGKNYRNDFSKVTGKKYNQGDGKSLIVPCSLEVTGFKKFVIKISLSLLLLVLWHKNFELSKENSRSGYKKLFELANVRVIGMLYCRVWFHF